MPNENSQDRAGSSNRTSQSLIGLIKANDSDAWDRLVTLYSPLIYFWCHRSGLPSQETPDVFQEIFQAVAKNIHKFRHDQNGTFRGWLSVLTRNKISDHYRIAGREPRPTGGTEATQFFELIPESEQPDKSASGDDELFSGQSEVSIRRELLQRALSNIRPHFHEQTWQAFWKVVIDGRETTDVANELAMQSGTVRVAKSRVLKRLRQEFGDSDD